MIDTGGFLLDIAGWEQQVLDLNPGDELIFEAQSKRHCYWIVLEGLAHATVEGVSIDLEPGHVINIAPHSQSRLKNFGLNKLRVLSTSMEIVKKKV